MECLPIVQDDFPPDYRSVREMLVTKIKTCDAVVHLAGFYYGAEPMPVPAEADRRSFTQLEYEIAMELGLPCYLFLCGEKFPFDEHDPELDEKRALQLAHRGRLLSRDELFYEFETREDLNSRTRELLLSVEALRDELVQERRKRMMTMMISAAALVVASLGGIFLFQKTQTQEGLIAEASEKLDEQGELIAMLLAEQETIRGESEGGGDIAAQAEANVAERLNLSPEKLRAGILAAIKDAERDVETAKDPAEKVVALKALADAQQAGGLETEAVETYEKRYLLIDRDEEPVEWLRAFNRFALPTFEKDMFRAETHELVADAVEFAEASPELGAEHAETLVLYLLQARVFVLQRKKEESLQLRLHIVEVRKRTLGSAAPETLSAMANLAIWYKNDGNFAKADEIYLEMVDLIKVKNGLDHEETCVVRAKLATSYQAQERYLEAETLFKDLVARSTQVLGAAHKTTLDMRFRLFLLYRDQAREEDALEVLQALREDGVQKHGFADSLSLVYSEWLADELFARGETEKGISLMREALNARIHSVGMDQISTIEAIAGLARALRKDGQMDAYFQAMEENIAACVRVYGADSVEVSKERYDQAFYLNEEERFAEALPHAEECARVRLEVYGLNYVDTSDALALLQRISIGMRSWEEGERWGYKALEAYESITDPDPTGYAQTLYDMALCKWVVESDSSALGYLTTAKAVAGEAKNDYGLLDKIEELIDRINKPE